jgi:hypothetical protein
MPKLPVGAQHEKGAKADMSKKLHSLTKQELRGLVIQAAGERAIDWYEDTDECFFCVVREGLHEDHCDLGTLFGFYEEDQ